MAVSLALGHLFRTGPRQTLLDLTDLLERLFGDRQRLDENRHVAKLPRYDVHVGLVVDDHLGHEAVGLFDPALAEVARVAEILATGPTGHAIGVRAGTADHWDHEIAGVDPRHLGADLHGLAERFVADDENVGADGRGPVVEGTDLPVGAADSDIEYSEFHL